VAGAAKPKKYRHNHRGFITPVLRRASLRWPPRNETLRLSRVSRGYYSCAMCKGTFHRKEVVVDHIDPVIDPQRGFTTWDEFIARLFVETGSYQTLCYTCHKAKSMIENNIRDAKKKLAKKKKKD